MEALSKMLFAGSILGEHRRKALRFGKTKSHAIITNSTVPPDCIERVISQRGEMTIYQRTSTPRPAPRIVLQSAWHEQQQQQQQQQDVSRNSRETAGGTLSRRCSQHCSEGAAAHCPRPQASTMLRKKKDHPKSIFEFMEYRKTTTKTRSG